MNKILVYSKKEFNIICEINNIDDTNVENIDKTAFISINNSKNDKSYFQKEHNNVLILEFDDISEEEYKKNNDLKLFSEKDAEKIIKFIDNNLNKDILIHCTAGISRSQAVFRFLTDYYPNFQKDGRWDNPCLYPNQYVLLVLKKVFNNIKK